MHIIEIVSTIYLAVTVLLYLWGLAIRFYHDGVSLHVLGYHTLASLIGADMYGNVLTAGDFSETISSRLGIAAKQNLWWGLIGDEFLDQLQKGHCQLAIVNDMLRDRAEAEKLKENQ